MKEICGAPDCNRYTARSHPRGRTRRVAGVQLCGACYQKLWRLSHVYQMTREALLEAGILHSPNIIPRIETTCVRHGCGKRLMTDDGGDERRTVEIYHLCRSCYSAALRWSKKRNISLLDALFELKAKGKHQI
jgi:hypothetical protein